MGFAELKTSGSEVGSRSGPRQGSLSNYLLQQLERQCEARRGMWWGVEDGKCVRLVETRREPCGRCGK